MLFLFYFTADNDILPVCSELPEYGTPCIRVGVPVKGYDGKFGV